MARSASGMPKVIRAEEEHEVRVFGEGPSSRGPACGSSPYCDVSPSVTASFLSSALRKIVRVTRVARLMVAQGAEEVPVAHYLASSRAVIISPLRTPASLAGLPGTT